MTKGLKVKMSKGQKVRECDGFKLICKNFKPSNPLTFLANSQKLKANSLLTAYCFLLPSLSTQYRPFTFERISGMISWMMICSRKARMPQVIMK